MWHFSLKAIFKGVSPFTGLSNLCLLSCFPTFSNFLSPARSMDYTPWLYVIGETVAKEDRENIFVNFAGCKNIPTQREKSHMNFTLSIALSISRSISGKWLSIFSPVLEKKNVSVLGRWIYNVHITDLRKRNWLIPEVGFHTVRQWLDWSPDFKPNPLPPHPTPTPNTNISFRNVVPDFAPFLYRRQMVLTAASLFHWSA